MAVLCALLVSTAVHLAAPPIGQPIAVRLEKLTVEVPNADVLHVTLHAGALPGGPPPGVVGQRLTLAESVRIPLATPVSVAADAQGTHATFDLRLRDVPEGVLSIDPNRLPVRWEGFDTGGTVLLVLAGTLDLGDPGEVELPIKKLYDTYARMNDFTITPGLTAVSVHALLNLYNPFAFDVVATRLLFSVKMGAQTVLTAQRPGFRLHAGQRSDVLIEQDVPLSDVAGGVGAFLRGEPGVVDGTIAVRTPQGERTIPLHLRAGP